MSKSQKHPPKKKSGRTAEYKNHNKREKERERERERERELPVLVPRLKTFRTGLLMLDVAACSCGWCLTHGNSYIIF